MVKGKTNPQSEAIGRPGKILRFSLALFLLTTFVIAVLRLLPWSAPLAVLEIPLNYSPQWLPLLLLVPLLILWRQTMKLSGLRIAVLSLASAYIVFVHMDFSLPLKGAARDLETFNLRVLSANLAQVDADKFAALLRSEKPDVIVTQEIRQSDLAPLLTEMTGQLLTTTSRKGNTGKFSNNTERAESKIAHWQMHCESNLCLVSRYPFKFVEAQSRRFRGAWGLLGAAYDMQVDGEPLRLFNVHLETVRKGFENVSLTRLDLDAILVNANNRKTEAELLASWIGRQKPVVVVGDFNMTTGESLYRDNFGEFRNAYAEVGFGLGHTKLTRLLRVRIDHLLSTADVLPFAARVGGDIGSDHRPLLVDLTLGR